MKLQLFLVLFWTSGISSEGPPTLLSDSNPKKLRVKSGSKAHLHCFVNDVKDFLFFEWSKDKHPIDVIEKGRFRLSRSGTLKIKYTIPQDTGHYLCKAVNGFGSVETSIFLSVYEADEGKKKNTVLKRTNQNLKLEGSTLSPKIKKIEMPKTYPINTTVEHGKTAIFQCRVRSSTTPHIQWLKKVAQSDAKIGNVVKVDGSSFRILNSSEVFHKPNGLFLHKLQISEAQESDAGQYVCLGTNTLGYSYRSAFLNVIPKLKMYDIRNAEQNGKWSERSNVLLISLPISTGLVIIAFLAILMICRRRKQTIIPKFKKGKGKSKGILKENQQELSDKENEVFCHLKNSSGTLTASYQMASGDHNKKCQEVAVTTFTNGASTMLLKSDFIISQDTIPAETVIRGESVITRLYSSPPTPLPLDEEALYIPVDTV
ncbi:fibroblast growth factor receptor-like 1 [Tachypleus tridentatus]|uniref:fibroblast growth factor receptor-like 1 n=1 Tax=Tachypleus tridentatus TaxID=6853 RepID=UPI003FCF23E8